MLTSDCRNLFSFAEHTAYLDHGGFGVMPREILDARREALQRVERAPAAFFALEYRPLWKGIAELTARRYSAAPHDLALIDNVTDGINAVLRSLSFAADDEILITSLVYGAVANAAEYIARAQGGRVVRAQLRFPDPDPEQCIEALRSAITPRTKLAILEHVTSATALVLPIAPMIEVCHEYGVPVLVDGAHVPGNIRLDLQSLSADWYAANLHKWAFVPRGCGFLCAAKKQGLVPTVLSWDIGNPFPQSFEWTGTRDPSAWLSIPPAFAFSNRFGEDAIIGHNHRLIRDAIAILSQEWNVAGNIPDDMIGSMALAPLPPGLPFPATLDGCSELRRVLWETHGIVASPSFAHGGTSWIRISAQIYNDAGDYLRLARTINSMRTK